MKTSKELETIYKAKSLRWRTRRRLAYISITSIIMVTYWAFFKLDIDKLNALKDIISWFYTIMGSIIGSYVGFSTIDDKWQNEYKEAKEIIEAEQEEKKDE